MCNLPRMKNDYTDEALLEWQARQPDAFTGDPLWRLDTYREALYLADRVRADVIEAGVPGSYAAMKEQLLTSVGSIAANIAEGYGRPTTADRVRFLSYALGSAREALTWYQTLPSSIDRAAFDDRIARLARIRRMLLGLLTRLRKNCGRKFDPW